MSLVKLLNDSVGLARQPGKIYGVVTGIVRDIKDPDNLGRVKVDFPWLAEASEAVSISSSDDRAHSYWARLATPMAGKSRGLYLVPEVGEEVLVAFEHGDPDRPFVLGGLWNADDTPPESMDSNGSNDVRSIHSRCGHVIVLNDKQGEEQVSVTSKSGHTVILNDKSGSESITIKDKTGNNSMVIDSSKNSMTISLDGDFIVDAKGKVTIKSAQDMSLESQANGTVKGMQLTLEGTSKAEVKAATVSVAGQAMTEVKGGLVKIN